MILLIQEGFWCGKRKGDGGIWELSPSRWFNGKEFLKCRSSVSVSFITYFRGSDLLDIWLSPFSINNDHSYPKGLIVAFTLKKNSSEGSAEQNGTDEPTKNGSTNGEAIGSSENPTEETVQKSEDTNADNKDEETPAENVDNKTDLETDEKETKNEEKPSEDSIAEDEESKEKSNATAYKNNKDVVMREDLKSIFQKFGNVKVSFTTIFFPSKMFSRLRFISSDILILGNIFVL